VTVVGGVMLTAAELAGVTRDSDNRTINSLGNIVRQSSLVAQRQTQHGGMSPDERTERAVQTTTDSINRMKQSTDEKIIGTTNSINRMKQSSDFQGAQTRATVRTAEATSAARIVAATAAQTGAIVGAIFAARPVVNVTNVTRSTTIQQRYGPSNGSAGQDPWIGRGD
jgi:hypothetical protein